MIVPELSQVRPGDMVVRMDGNGAHMGIVAASRIPGEGTQLTLEQQLERIIVVSVGDTDD